MILVFTTHSQKNKDRAGDMVQSGKSSGCGQAQCHGKAVCACVTCNTSIWGGEGIGVGVAEDLLSSVASQLSLKVKQLAAGSCGRE